MGSDRTSEVLSSDFGSSCEVGVVSRRAGGARACLEEGLHGVLELVALAVDPLDAAQDEEHAALEVVEEGLVRQGEDRHLT